MNKTAVMKIHTIDEPKNTLFLRPILGLFINHRHKSKDKTYTVVTIIMKKYLKLGPGKRP